MQFWPRLSDSASAYRSRGGRLFADAPAGALTSELRAAIAARRGELIRRLSPPGTTTDAAPIAADPLAAQNSPAWGMKPIVNPLCARPADRFANWVLRRDVTGKLGWEAPDVPESSRWWARFTFDQLPQVALNRFTRPYRPPTIDVGEQSSANFKRQGNIAWQERNG